MSQNLPYFSHTPDNGFERHATAAEAIKVCRSELDEMRHEAMDVGWDETVSEICWGHIEEVVVETDRLQRPPDEELEGGCDSDGQYWSPGVDEMVDFKLRPTEATCTWSQHPQGRWITGCKEEFEFIDGTPSQNKFRACPYCGRPLQESNQAQA